jgi:hypothetical protein
VTEQPSSDARVDELRQHLKALGYLDAGVDRFVLGPAQATRSPALIALLASVRSGIVAGALLGPAAALGVGGRLPGLVTGIRDAIVLAVYLGGLFAAAVAGVSFATALAVSSLGRTGRTLSTGAGTFVAVACLAYLTLWWRTANAGFGWEAPAWTAFALVVAVAISLLLGHVVALTARAVLVARAVPDPETPRVRGTSWRLVAVAGAAAFAGAAALLILTAERRVESAPALTVRSAGVRVTVFAIDGFDPALYEQLRPVPAAPREPRLFDVFDRARANLAPEDSSDPARLWTTIATGRRPEAHGVERLQTREIAGLRGRLGADSIGRVVGGATDLLRLTRPAIASNLERRVKTFWEIAAQAGLRTGVVNWWATWPADPSAGVVVSDRGILRLEHGGALDAEIAPPELYEGLKASWPKLQADAEISALYIGNAHVPEPQPSAEIRTVLTRSAELDARIIKLARAIGGELDLLVVYLPGLDIAQHTLFGEAAPAPSEVTERLSALRRYYAYIEWLVGPGVGLATQEQDRALFVITQPGRLRQGAGVFAALGTAFGATRTDAGVLDVAPTILHALGVPVADDLDGRVVQELFTPAARSTYPVRTVESYGLKGPASAPRSGQPLDEEMIDRLRSLGYVR